MRLSTGLVFAVAIALGCNVYRVANHYETVERKLARTEAKIDQEQEALRVLQAEWTFLTSPSRLEKISQTYLGLQAMDGRQYVEIAAIPMRDSLDTSEQAQEEMIAQAAPSKTQEKIREVADNGTALPRQERALPPLHITPVSVTGDTQ